MQIKSEENATSVMHTSFMNISVCDDQITLSLD